MRYFKCLSGVSISVVVILILLPILQAMGEEKSNTDDGNTESVKNESATGYTISIKTTKNKISLYTDGKLIGKTPFTLNLKKGDVIELYGFDEDGAIVFIDTVEGGKTPSNILIQYPKRYDSAVNNASSFTGAVVGVNAGVLMMYIIFILTFGG